jgi:hypothetical protein
MPKKEEEEACCSKGGDPASWAGGWANQRQLPAEKEGGFSAHISSNKR